MMKYHHPELSYSCGICGLNYIVRDKLREHLDRHYILNAQSKPQKASRPFFLDKDVF